MHIQGDMNMRMHATAQLTARRLAQGVAAGSARCQIECIRYMSHDNVQTEIIQVIERIT